MYIKNKLVESWIINTNCSSFNNKHMKQGIQKKIIKSHKICYNPNKYKILNRYYRHSNAVMSELINMTSTCVNNTVNRRNKFMHYQCNRYTIGTSDLIDRLLLYQFNR